MQIPDEIRKCVAFLACRKNSGPEERGTVFFVGYSLPANEAIAVIYAVTARHVIEGLANDGDGNAYCRVNTRQHGVQFLPIPMSQWVFSDDSQVDVAVAPLAFDFKHLDHKVLPLGMFITPEVVAEEQVGIGDDLFFPGLFTQRPGKSVNIPIIRIGNIAAMPEEPVETGWGVLRPPYLVEARSIGGLSGSPVFWYRGATRLRSGTLVHVSGAPTFLLLGLVHGHYIDRGGTRDTGEPTVADRFDRRSENMGIAIVVPAKDILDTLNHPDLEQQRNFECQRILATKAIGLPMPEIAAMRDVPGDMVTREHATPRTVASDASSSSRSKDASIESTKLPTPPINP